MNAAGMTKMNMAFEQLGDASGWGSGNFSRNFQYDSLNQLVTIMNKNVPGAGQEMLKHIASEAKKYGVSWDLSFGGEAARPSQMELTQGSAQSLIKFCQEYGITSVDFDLEGSGVNGFLKTQCDHLL